jgi:hypothetical protein
MKKEKEKEQVKLPNIKKNGERDWTSKQLDIYQPKEESEKLRGDGFWNKQGEEQEILRHISRTYNKFRA